jgi:hypothetical protein
VSKPRAVGLLAVCLTVKPVGEPDAGDRHVRFDERGWETERRRMAQVTAPILDSTEAAVRRNAAILPVSEERPTSRGHHRRVEFDPERTSPI